MGRIFDGREIARDIRNDVRRRIGELGEGDEGGGMGRSRESPVLAVISVGEDHASEVYIGQKRKAAREVGIGFREIQCGSASTSDLIETIHGLNRDPEVHGILVQLPLPATIRAGKVMGAISPEKDVDGFHPLNYGRLLLGEEGLAPCTPRAVMRMLDHERVHLRGKDVVIVNHSAVVGKPLALMMLARDATVTVCHVHTGDLARHTREADVLVTAAGVPGLVGPDGVKEGAVVVDVSMNRRDHGLCGDVRFGEVLEKASLVTPVPGGVGPVTVAVLMENTLSAFLSIRGGAPESGTGSREAGSP